MKNLLDMTIDELAAELAEMGQPAYRTSQIATWVYRKGVYDFEKMTDLSAELRTALAERMTILTGKVVTRSDSPDGVTKLLVEFADGMRVETVLIPAEGRASACVSTQVGCSLGCTFCASGANGLQRSLRSGEIVEQILHIQQATGTKVSHVVFMGMGEPLANIEATVQAIHAIVDEQRLGISARRVTVSTIGLPKAIRRLARENLPITLAISLHAPNDAIRRQIMPKAGASIDEIIAAAQEFFAARKRELTLEYILLEGVNDTSVCAEALSRIAAQLRCNVNLIRYNPVPSAPYKAPSQAGVKMFAERLARKGVNVQIRRSRGADADAACGQLRKRIDPPEGSGSPDKQ